jgi:hypothetical protein
VKQSKTVWWVRGVEAGKRGGPWGREEQLTAKAWDGAHASEICWRPSTRHEGRERERGVWLWCGIQRRWIDAQSVRSLNLHVSVHVVTVVERFF